MVNGPMTEGWYPLAIKMTSSLGVMISGVTIPIIVASTGSMLPYLNNIGISDDSMGNGNFDGAGYSYSAQSLAAAGVTPGSTIKVPGTNYRWPNVTLGEPDNIEVSGQTITFNETSTKTTINLLGSATDSDSGGAQGAVKVTYADGTTQSVPIAFTDWTKGGGAYPLAPGNMIALTTAYRAKGTSRDDTTSYVYTCRAQLTDTSSTVASVTLPSNGTGGTIHVFDVELN